MTRRLPRSGPMRRFLLELADEAERVAKNAREAAEAYSWAEPAGWNRTVGESVGSQPGHTTPTENVAVAKSAQRQAVRKATTKLIQGASRFAEARDILDDALDRTDRHADRGTRVTPFPRIVTTADLDASRQAQERRTARGAGWGEG